MPAIPQPELGPIYFYGLFVGALRPLQGLALAQTCSREGVAVWHWKGSCTGEGSSSS